MNIQTYILLGVILGPIFLAALVSTWSQLSPYGHGLVAGPKDERVLVTRKSWSPINIEVLRLVLTRSWALKWKWFRAKCVWEMSLVLVSCVAFWPLVALQAIVAYAIFVARKLLFPVTEKRVSAQ
jgi:hypothetical protein